MRVIALPFLQAHFLYERLSIFLPGSGVQVMMGRPWDLLTLVGGERNVQMQD